MSGYASGFAAGASAVNGGIANAMKYLSIKEQREARKREAKIAADNAKKDFELSVITENKNAVDNVNKLSVDMAKAKDKDEWNTYNALKGQIVSTMGNNVNTIKGMSNAAGVAVNHADFSGVNVAETELYEFEGNKYEVPKGAGKAFDNWNKNSMLKVTDTGTLAIMQRDESGKGTDVIHKEFDRFGRKDNSKEISLSPSEKKHYEEQGYTPMKEEVLAARKEKATANTKSIEVSGRKDRLVNFMDKMDTQVGWDKPITNQTIAEAEEFQAKNKIDPTTKRESLAKIGAGKRLYDVTKRIVDEGIEFNASEKAKTSIYKVSDREFTWDSAMDFLGIPEKELSEAEKNTRKTLQKQMLSKISADTTINSVVADYVKIISGAAVTDEERTRFLHIITGGEYSSTKARIEAMTSFIEDIDKSYKLTFDSYKDTNPYEYAAAVKSYQSITKGMDTKSLRAKAFIDKEEKEKKKLDISKYKR